jgi:hypothetical protein
MPGKCECCFKNELVLIARASPLFHMVASIAGVSVSVLIAKLIVTIITADAQDACSSAGTAALQAAASGLLPAPMLAPQACSHN